MNANKIILNDQVLIDLTQDTAVEEDVAKGKTFHKADGSVGVGAAKPGAKYNFHFGEEPPEDTTKLWCKTTEPDNIIIADKNRPTLMPYKLPVPLASMACAAVGTKIYTFGGWTNSQIHETAIYCIDTETGVATTCSVKLSRGLRKASAIPIGSKIYVIGGVRGNDGVSNMYGSNSHYCYDTETDTITTLTVGIGYKFGSSCVAVGKYIYIFGGDQSTGSTYGSSYSSTVNRYDTEEGTITSVEHNTIGSPVFGNHCSWFRYKNRIYFPPSTSSSDMPKPCYYDLDTDTLSILDDCFITSVTINSATSYTLGDMVYCLNPAWFNSSGMYSSGRLVAFDFGSKTVSYDQIMPYLDECIQYGGATAIVGSSIYSLGGETTFSETYSDLIYRVDLPIHTPSTNNDMVLASGGYSVGSFKVCDDPEIRIGLEGIYKLRPDSNPEKIDVLKHYDTPGIKRTRYFTHNCVDVDSDTSLSCDIRCSTGDLVVAAIATRDTLTLSDGWTLVATSEVNSNDTTAGQRLSFAWKFADNDRETITVTQASAQRLYVNMVAISGATGVSFNSFTYVDEQATEITCPKPTGAVLWSVTSPLWYTTPPYPGWSTENDMYLIQLDDIKQQRLAIGLDHSNAESVTFHPSSSSTMVAGALAIEGIDAFYHDEPYTDIWKPYLNKKGSTNYVDYLE